MSSVLVIVIIIIIIIIIIVIIVITTTTTTSTTITTTRFAHQPQWDTRATWATCARTDTTRAAISSARC